MYIKFLKFCIKKISTFFFIENNLTSFYALRQSIFILEKQQKINFLGCILRFFFHWFKILFSIFSLKKLLKKNNYNFLINIQETAIYDKKSFTNFYNFFFETLFYKKFNADFFFIHGNFNYSFKSNKFKRIIDLHTSLICLLNFNQKILAIYYHFSSLINFIFLIILCPKVSYLYKEFSEYSIYRALNKKKIKVFSHQNNFMYPFLCWKMVKQKNEFVSYSMLYSMNSFPIERNKYLNFFHITNNWKYLQLDYFITWNKKHSNLMKNLNNKTKIIEYGPVLYYLDNKKNKKLKGKIKVLIFDVEPSNKLLNDKNNYYNFMTCKQFITDIFESFSNYFHKDVCLYLKHKDRGRLSLNNIPNEYFSLIRSFKNKYNKNFFLLERDENIYEIIRSVDIVIGIPFTSPIFIAKKLKKINFFYDTRNIPNFDTGIKIINNRISLNKFVKKLITNLLNKTKLPN